MIYDSADDKTHLTIVNAIIIRDGKVLVSKRSLKEPHQPGRWTIPGGKIERTKGGVKDILLKTLRDEVKEEVGVEIGDDISLVYDNTFIRSTGHHVIALTFLRSWKSGEARALEDTIEVKWVSRGELGQIDFAPEVKEYIESGFGRFNEE